MRLAKVAVTVMLLAVSAVSAAGPLDHAARPNGMPVEAAPTEAAASAAARWGNRSVRVDSLTDEFTEVRANPDGTMTMTQHVLPVRVRRGDGWVAADPTLSRNATGSVSPQATVVGLELSAGGPGSKNKPVVRAGVGGAEIGLRWAFDVPEPVLSGPTATYPEVLPGVDLRVTAEVTGFSEVLVVKTPQAARNPALRRITFGTHAEGLKVSVADGTLRAVDGTGKVVFVGDASRMWDSSAAGARAATMGVEVTDDAVTIVPDQDFLFAPDTAYPVHLDPSYRCGSCGKAHHNVVQSAYPGATNFDRTDGDLGDLKAGYWCTGDCPKISRTFLRMHTGQLAGRVIHSASMHVRVVNSARCGDARATRLALTGYMDGGTTWNTQPGGGDNPGVIMWLGEGNRTNNATHCPSDGGMDLEAKAGIERAAASGWGETTFALLGANEGDNLSWRRFDLNPYMVVEYNSYPNGPAAMGTEGWGPNPGDAVPCVWGAGRPFIPTRTPRLRAIVSDPDGGTLDAGFRVGGPNGEGEREIITGAVPSGSFAEVTVPAGFIPGDGIFRWHLWSSDPVLVSWSAPCQVQVDTVRPGSPVVSSTLYPSDRPAGGVGKTGTFTFNPGPATDDTAFYEYAFTTQGGVPQTRATPAALNGPVTVSWTPTLSGPQTLSVRAVDRAGNRSDIVPYKVVVSDYQVGVSGKVAQWSLEDTLADTAAAKSLAYEGSRPGPGVGPGHTGQGVVVDPAKGEFYRAKDALIRTDTSYTVSAWAKLTRDDGIYAIASQDGNRRSGVYLLYHGGFKRWAVIMPDHDDVAEPGWYAARSADPPVLNEWTHLTGVFDSSSNTLRLYVNGQLQEQIAAPPTTWNATGQFIVGAAKTDGQRTHVFSGAIDSVRVHPRALSATEIAALAGGGATAAPAAEYLFENNLNNTGATNDLSQPDGVSYTAGYSGRALRINSGGRWAQSSAPLINTTASFSVAAWVRLDNKNSYYHVASQDGTAVSGFMLRYGPGGVDRWMFGVPREDTTTDTYQWAIGQTVPVTGVWTHLAAVHDASTHRLQLYVNGVLDAQRDNLAATIDARGPFVVGAAFLGGRASPFVGDLDEVNVYDGALNPAEVAKLANVPVERARYALNETSGAVARDSVGGAQATVYGSGITWGQHYGSASASFTGSPVEHAGTVAGSGPAARWELDGALNDVSGNGRNLVHGNNSGPTAATYTTSARLGRAVVLNGVDQRLTAAGQVVDTTKSYSVAAWVRLDRKDGWRAVAAQDGTSISPFYLQYSPVADRWMLSVTQGDSVEAGVVRAPSRLAPQVGVWTHLLGVYDATAGVARLYVNGQLEGTVAVPSVWPSTGTFTVGRGKWAGNPVDFFPGVIDEVRVYDRVLTPADAHSLWNLASNLIAPRPAIFRADQSFVLSTWVRIAQYDADVRIPLAFDGDRYSPLILGYRPDWRRWSVYAASGSEASPVHRFVLSDNEAGTYAQANGWVHLSAVYDAPAKRVRLYVNGIPQSTVPDGPTTVKKDVNAGSGTTLWDNGRGLLIGRVTWDGVISAHWKGALRDVRIFSGVLPEACDNVPVCMSQLPWQ